VDDHPVVRKGISFCLAQHEHLFIVGEAADGCEAVAKARALLPDIMLLDLDLPQMSGLAVAEVLRKELPNIKVLILSMQPQAEWLPRILQSGTRGYVLKGTSCEKLVKAIETVTAGECYFSPEIARLALIQVVQGNGARPNARKLNL
jgi:DNA-binding NarL/FixJ family response regulator